MTRQLPGPAWLFCPADRAERYAKAAAAAEVEGNFGVFTFEGRMVDGPIIEQAERILARAR